MNSMQILCFLKAAELLNFTESAAAMFISQPAFSHNISTLEEEWGFELFVRSNKRKDTQLTPGGAVLYEGMRKLRVQYENLLEKVRSIQEGSSGVLRIGFIGAERIDERTLDMFELFKGKYPGVELHLRRGSQAELIQWLYDKSIDLAFLLKIDVELKDLIEYKQLYNIESVLILNARHPLAKREDLSLADFREETFLNISARESPHINAMLKLECEKAGFTLKVTDAQDVNAQLLYLELGMGVAVGSINNTAVFNPRLTMVRLKELRPLEVVLAWNRQNENPCIGNFGSVYELIE